jgi:hypothetical protein
LRPVLAAHLSRMSTPAALRGAVSLRRIDLNLSGLCVSVLRGAEEVMIGCNIGVAGEGELAAGGVRHEHLKLGGRKPSSTTRA